jgi:hypothetical protein
MVLGLFGWYIFIQNQQNAIGFLGQKRGFSSETPTFGGSTGSTNALAKRSLIQEVIDQVPLLGGGEAEQSTSSVVSIEPVQQLSPTPSVGTFFSSKTPTIVYFVERVSGNLFSRDLQTGEVTRVTNTLIPYMQEIIPVNETTFIARRFIEEEGVVQPILATVVAASSTYTLKEERLSSDFITAVGSPTGTSFFYLAKTSGGYAGMVVDLATRKERRVFSSSLGGWVLEWKHPEYVTLVQKSAAGISGSAYTVSVTSGTMQPFIPGVAGLSLSAAPTTGHALYSESYLNSLSTYLLTPTGSTLLPFKTLGEKCAWANATTAVCAVPQEIPAYYPDSWYRGETHTVDSLWSINLTNGSAKQLTSIPFPLVDVWGPSIKNGMLLFTDRSTQTPWMVDVDL